MDDHGSEATFPAGRRGFCQATGSALALLAFAGLALPASAEPAQEDGPRQLPDTKAGLSPGQVKDYRKLGNFFLMADAAGVYAVSSLCTHAGCSVHAAASGFECPCHGSAFDAAGAVTQGPAKLALKHFEVRESSPGGALVVDLGKTVAPNARL